ncbi:MAG: hypothetical protein H0T72_04240 [Chloroflexia bacterium]|nr:hypothetical protein [Chloroflexia bacterium]
MTTRLKKLTRQRAMLAALITCLSFLVFPVLTGTTSARQVHEFSVTVDPLTSCAAAAPITGTVTLIGLTPGYGFYVQLQGDGEILDGQAFEGYDDYPDGTYEWSVSGDLSDSYDLLELSFTIHDGEGELIRNETLALNPDCSLFATGGPSTPPTRAGSPVATTPVPGALASGPASTPSSTPAALTGDDVRSRALPVAGFAGATVLVLTGLAMLDRRTEP